MKYSTTNSLYGEALSPFKFSAKNITFIAKAVLFLCILCFPFSLLKSQTAPTAVSSAYTDINDNSDDYSTIGTGGTYNASTTYNLSFSSSATTNNDLIIESVTVGGEIFFVTPAAATPLFRRNDNAIWTGEVEFLFLQKNSQSGDDVDFNPSFAATMEEALNSKIINRGTDNTFVNNDAGNGNNIERLDYVFLNGLNVARADGEGFALFERNGNDNMKIAPILTVDGSGNPTSFGNLVTISSGSGNWFNSGSSIVTTTFRDVDNTASVTLRPNEDIGAQNVTACFVSMSDLSITDGTTIYGYSLFGNDVTNGGDNANLLDWTNSIYFPTNTNSTDGGSDLIAGGVHVSLPNRDGTGPVDLLDIDDDDDGIPDVIEACGLGATNFSCLGGDPSDDSDGDLTPNYQDPDFCTLNAAGVCETLDTDGDGIIDQFDLDSDNDGIPDLQETGGTDSDKDGVVDDLSDTDGDGLADTYDSVCHDGTSPCGVTGTDIPKEDKDGDGILNYLDLDADNDGLPDIIEAGGQDINGDGQVDYPTPNDPASMTDLDLDGLADTYDDSDYNGNTDNWSAGTVIPNIDSDGDGITDHLDLDADDDGIPDLVEAGGIDSNGDGLVDQLNIDGTLTNDSDGDGFADHFDPDDDGTFGIDSGESTQPLVITDGSRNILNGETSASIDTDSDGLADFIDLDADNDGIPDLVEAGGIDSDGNGRTDDLTDADNDGYADTYDTDDDGSAGVEDATDALLQTGGTDTDSDGKADDAAITFVDGNGNNADHDGDGYYDGLDLDADNDGIPDIVEAGGTHVNGKVDVGLVPWDADGDGLADIYDQSASDGPSGSGTNGTALVETTADSNGDGIVNNAESMSAGGSNIINADGDSNPNHLDLDADNDGITDVVENASGDVTADHSTGTLDGIVGDNATVTDTDGDGWHDPSNSNTVDTDGDNIPDFLDIDADNDGIPDYLESVCSTCPTFMLPSGADSDGDGVLDIYEGLTTGNANSGSNTGATPNEDDNDGTLPYDYLDTDTDDDSAYDWSEGFDNNGDGNAADDLISIASTYETNNGGPGDYPTTDTDSDGLPDWMDNQPGVEGYIEATVPPYLDPMNSAWVDANNNGLADIFDTAMGGTNTTVPDVDGLNDADWRDQLTSSVLPIELTRFIARVINCNALIEWTVASEERFSHYELQHSFDGISFSLSTRLAGGSESLRYKYLDTDLNQKKYYRLKMVDLDQSVKYSDVVVMNTSPCSNNIKFSLYPNPVRLGETLHFEVSNYSGATEFIITNLIGEIVYTIPLNTSTSDNSIQLDISKLAQGTYFIFNRNAKNISPIKLIVIGN